MSKELGILILHLFILNACKCRITNLQPGNRCQEPSGYIPDEGTSCLSLDEALKLLENDHTLSLSPGTYTLGNFSTDVVRDISNVTIVGSVRNPQSVVITCYENVGLFFFNVSDLTITGVTIERCGIKGIDHINEIMNVTMELINVLYKPLPDFSTAIYMAHCPNLELSSVIVRDNRGFGLVGINLIGNVTFHQLQVYQNYPSVCVLDLERYLDTGGSGGGLFLLYQDYISESEFINLQNLSDSDLDAQLSFTKSNITDNYVCRLNLFNVLHDQLPLSIEHPPDLDLSLVGAGGLTYALAQSSYRVNASLDQCTFRNNSGTYNGAAMHVAQFELSSDSHVVIERSRFLDNGQELIRQYGEEGVGVAGALHIWYYTPNPLEVMNIDVAARLLSQQPSSVTVADSVFERNTARIGGAMFVLSFGGEINLIRDLLVLEYSTFSFNRADFGAALYLSELSYSGFQHGLNIRLNDIEITRNDKADTSASNVLQPEGGIVDVSFLNISLTGSNYIAYNNNTAMSLHSAILSVSDDSLFEYNVGSTGGAISLASESYVVLAGSTNLTFYHNTALIAGGAIYVNFGFTRFNRYDCFVHFVDIDFFCNLVRPCDYEQTFARFVHNTAPLGSAIYGSTLSNCPWAKGSTFESSDVIRSREDSVNRLVKFEPGLTIRPELDSDDFTIINTLPRTILPKDDIENLTILPGGKIKRQLGAFDQLNQSVPLTIFSQLALLEGTPSKVAKSSIGDSNRYLIDGAGNFTTVPINVFGTENSTYRVSISSNEAQVEFSFNVTLRACPLGFLYNYTSNTCTCNISSIFPDVTCRNNGSVTNPNGPWLGFLREENGFVLRRCVFDYCNRARRINLDNPDTQCRNNRAGILCGGCRESFSRALGSSRCFVCDNNGLSLIIVFAISGILLVVAVALFDITITRGYVNGVIFYANVISLYLTFSSDDARSAGFSTVMFIIRMVNLNFGVEACFYDGMSDLSLSLLSLLFPLYLGAILVVITLILKYCNTRRFAKLTNKVNVTHTFATLLLLSYSSIYRTSIGLLSYVDIEVNGRSVRRWRIDPNQHYFAGLHIFGFFVALFFLIVLTPFSFLLLFPNLSLRLPLMGRMKPLIDAFTAPLATGRQFWVGFRLISRNLLFLFILMDDVPRNVAICTFVILITILQAYIDPFKSTGRNLFDLQVMVNLTVVTFLAVIARLRMVYTATSIIIGLCLWTLFTIECGVLFVAYIVGALPCTEKLAGSVRTKFSSLQSKFKRVVDKYGSSAKAGKHEARRVVTYDMADDMTHTSVAAPSPLAGQLSDTGFASAQFVRYRESMFNELEMDDN